jgi:hypothetical protein
MDDINQMFEAFKITDSNNESFEKFTNSFSNDTDHHNDYKIKTIIIGDTNSSDNSKENKHA